MTDGLTLGGDRLKRGPKGIDPDHPMIEELKRKDFVCFTKIHSDGGLFEPVSWICSPRRVVRRHRWWSSSPRRWGSSSEHSISAGHRGHRPRAPASLVSDQGHAHNGLCFSEKLRRLVSATVSKRSGS